MYRKTLAGLALTAATVGGVGAMAVPSVAEATPSTASSSNYCPPKGFGLPCSDVARQQLVDLVGTDRVEVIIDSGGQSGDLMYQGAVITGNNSVAFYQYGPGGGWTKEAERSIPPAVSGAEGRVWVQAHQVAGLNDPIFLVGGAFTNDGSAGVIAFGRGETNPNGWGVLVGHGPRLSSSGQGVTDAGQLGVELHIWQHNDMLETVSLWPREYGASIPEMIEDPIVRTWKGTGDTLTMASERGGPTD